ncbi:hypothetical protein LTR78_000809 [Recurvomyces mirabilis]|uniref:endo-1,4-beta-xylanase n=1 Tax=Recurvomyces mirabilis TaxID=574656 RepID=A0AAE0WWL9_9PEZI|nr:hypothetical protein LTR78_000809 [Recurvomyces mirabilis]KAK5158778.1 hypothetical protein LTS14_002886 [Recurvomyces mirabilis]
MVSFTSAVIAASVAVQALALPTELVSRSTANSQGTSGGYFYQFWSDGTGNVQYTNGDAGEYKVTWSNVGDFTSGKGWKTATDRTIDYSGTFVPGSNAYLAVYTWSGTGETYILENYGPYNPGTGGTHMGTLSSDGGMYDIYRVYRSATYVQYWSVRQQKRSSGTVTTKNHYDEYNKLGLTFNPATNATYQIVSTEGFGSTGSADITVSEGTSSGSTVGSASSGISSVVAPSSAKSSSVPLASSTVKANSSTKISSVVLASSIAKVVSSAAPTSPTTETQCEISITITPTSTATSMATPECEVQYVTV